jgi:hypothetical protein
MAFEISTACTEAPAREASIAKVPVPAPKSTTICPEEIPRRWIKFLFEIK